MSQLYAHLLENETPFKSDVVFRYNYAKNSPERKDLQTALDKVKKQLPARIPIVVDGVTVGNYVHKTSQPCH